MSLPIRSPAMRSCSLLCLIAVTIVGCKKDEAKASQLPAGSAAPTVAAGTVEIYVDDQPVGKLATREIGLWPRLDTLVPVAARRLGTWQTVTIVKGTATSSVQQPSSTYPELVPAIFPGEGGSPAFGMFDPVELAKHGKPALREDGITKIAIKLSKDSGRGQNDHSEGGGQDPMTIELTIKTPKGEQIVKGEKLLATPRQPIPGEDEGDAKGWPLSLILENAGVKGYKRLRLTGEAGSNLTLEKQDLDPKAAIPYVKLNRQGSLRFRVYKKQGDTWQPGADLRGLNRVEVLE